MDGFTSTSFGELNANGYDTDQDPGTTQEAVALLSEIADGGSILEFAIGTGRIALPLLERGHVVAGIEASPLMVDVMRQKPGGDQIETVIGDMATARLDRTFDHAILVFNTLFNLTTQESQIACFKNAARHLNRNGTFTIETYVPDLSSFVDGQRVQTKDVEMDFVRIEAAKHDRNQQLFNMQRIHITPNGMKLVPLPMRYSYPPELDLMARLAGFHLENRWGGWNKQPFTNDSKMHISVYRLSD